MNSSLFSILLWYKNACSCCKKTVFRFSKPKNSLNLFEVNNFFDIRYSPLFKLFLFYVCEDSLWRFIVQRCFCQQILIILQCIDLFNTPGIFFDNICWLFKWLIFEEDLFYYVFTFIRNWIWSGAFAN